MPARFWRCTLLPLLLAACSKHAPAPAMGQVAPAPAAAPNSAVGDGKLDPNDPRHGSRRLIGLDTPVFVDGVEVAVLRYGEMPAISAIEGEGGSKRFRLVDYLEKIGVPVAAVQSVHLHGNGDKIASVEGSELRKQKDRFVFSYLSGDTGAPMQKWDTDRLKNAFVIHEIRTMTVYVKQPPPAIHAKKQCHVGADGACSDAIPYAKAEPAKGTRVYVDGKMVGFVKRRQLGDAVIMESSADGDHTYSLAKLVGQMGVDAESIETVEFVAGDDVIGRARADQVLAATYFTLPKHHHGKVRMHVFADAQAPGEHAADADALVSAVMLYAKTKPANREVVRISEDTDLSVMLAIAESGRGERGGL